MMTVYMKWCISSMKDCYAACRFPVLFHHTSYSLWLFLIPSVQVTVGFKSGSVNLQLKLLKINQAVLTLVLYSYLQKKLL